MELDDDDLTEGKSSKDVRKNIPIKLKSGKGRGRPRKVSKGSRSTKKKDTPPKERKEFPDEPDLDLDEPREEFSTMKVTGEEPVHKAQKLKWDHKVNLIGIKVVDPIIHTCSTCLLPILIYGRMIPCKHVFCFDCAKKTDKVCPRCNDPVNRVEQSALGAVFVCNYGGSKHGVSGCRRTYLSQRDLQAHINYRHLKQEQAEPKQAPPPAQQAPPPTMTLQQAPPLQVAITSPGGQIQGYGGLPMTSPPVQPVTIMAGHPPQDHTMVYHQPQQQQAPHGPPPQHHRQEGLSHGTPPLQPNQHPPPSGQIVHQGMPPPQAIHQGNHSLPPPPHSQGPMTQPPTRMPPPPVTSHGDSFHSIPVMSSTRTSNLITVPIQDESDPYGRREQQQPPQQYQQPPPTQQGPVVTSQPQIQQQFHHPPPGPGQTMMSGPPPPTQQHYNPSSINHNTAGAPMMNQPPPFSATTHLPPPQGMITSHPPPMTGPRPMNVNLSQPPPNTAMPHTGVPPPPRQGPPPQGPPIANRYPAPPRPPFDNKSNMYGQPPPSNPRTWQGGPPPGPPMGSGPPPPCNPNNANNMGPPPQQQRPFYQ